MEGAEQRAAAAAGRVSTLHAQLNSQTGETAALRNELAAVAGRCAGTGRRRGGHPCCYGNALSTRRGSFRPLL